MSAKCLPCEKPTPPGLKFDYYPGIYGSLVKPMYDVVKKSGATEIGNENYMACALAHLSIYKHALSNGRKRIYVLEDDLLFSSRFK
jgi:hypothetical protein